MKAFILSLSIILFSLSTLFAQDTYTDLFEGSKTIVLDGIFKDLNLKKGVAKMVVPVDLPKESKGFYYRITVLPKKVKQKQTNAQGLLTSIQAIADNKSNTEVVNQIDTYHSAMETNIYFLQGSKNADGLKNYGHYKYREKFIGYRSFSGYMENIKMDDFYIGVENKYELRGVKVILEVVAVQ